MKYAHVTKKLLLELEDVPALQSVPPGEAQKALSRVLEELIRLLGALPEGEALSLQGFGKFRRRMQPERSHWNMSTKVMETIPAKVVLTFEPSEAMKQKL